jgi:hypothetical protein
MTTQKQFVFNNKEKFNSMSEFIQEMEKRGFQVTSYLGNNEQNSTFNNTPKFGGNEKTGLCGPMGDLYNPNIVYYETWEAYYALSRD